MTTKDNPLFIKAETAELYWIKRARDNPADFMTYMTEGDKRPAKHHLRWMGAMFDPVKKNTIIQAWPGSAKTSISVYSLAYVIGKMPWLTHGIFSVSEEQAKQRLSEVREIIMNPRYKNVFPWIEIDYKRPNNAAMINVWSKIWRDGSKVDYAQYRSLIGRFGEARDHTVFAAGVTSKSITGKRISGWKIIDDPHNETNSATPEQREKVTNAIKKEILSRAPAKSKYARTIIIMTPWAEDDCAGRLMQDKTKDGSLVWNFLKTPIRDESGKPAWPEVFDEIRIEEIESEQGPIIFELMYLLNPLAAGSRQITLDMLRKPLPAQLPEFREVVIGIDFAETKGLKADYTVFSAEARDTEKRWNLYVLEMERFQEDEVQNRVERLSDFCDLVFQRYGKISKIVFEENDARSEIQLFADRRPDLPINALRPKGGKEDRFKRLAGWIQQGRVFWNTNSPVYHAACSELIGFGKSAHDDCVDSLDIPFQLPEWAAKFVRAGTKTVRNIYMI